MRRGRFTRTTGCGMLGTANDFTTKEMRRLNTQAPRRRVNRGFIVSMVLLGLVAVYVLVTQLMLLPAKAEVGELTDALNRTLNEASQLTDDRLTALRDDPAAQAAEADRVKKELQAHFVKDSEYLDAAVTGILARVEAQISGQQRFTKLEQTSRKVDRCMIDDNVASIQIVYRYRLSGEFQNYLSSEQQTVTDKEMIQTISAVCEMTDDGWKLSRISSMNRYFNGWDDGMEGVSLT